MSAIIAVQKDNTTAVSWDTLTTGGSATSPNAVPVRKVHRFGQSAVGVAGLSVYYVMLEHYLRGANTDTLQTECDVFAFFLAFWKHMKEEFHFVDDQSDREEPSPFADLGAEFLVATKDRLFVVREILSVKRFDRFCAIGSGASHAEGVAEVLYATQDSACEIARRSVEVATQFDRACGGPVEVLEF